MHKIKYGLFPDVAVIYRTFQIFLDNELNDVGISHADYPYIMAMLNYREEGILQDELVKKLVIARSATTRTLKSLEKKGLIYRKDSPTSKRHKMVYPTKKLYTLEILLEEAMKKWRKIAFKSITNEELGALIPILGKARDNVRMYRSHTTK